MTGCRERSVLYRLVHRHGWVAAWCALSGCALPIGITGGVAHGYVHAQAFGDPLRPHATTSESARASTELSVAAPRHPGFSVLPQEPGTRGFAAEVALMPSGSRGFTLGVEAAGPLAECGYHGAGMLVQGLAGWSLLPLPDEPRLGGELLAVFGGSGIGATESACQNGFFVGGRAGAPLRISPSSTAYALDDDHSGPTEPVFYLVPEVDLVRYVETEPGAEPRTALAFSAMVSVRVLFWSRMEP